MGLAAFIPVVGLSPTTLRAGIAVCCGCGPCLGEATESCLQDVRRRVVGQLPRSPKLLLKCAYKKWY